MSTSIHPIFAGILAAHFPKPAPKRWNLAVAQRGIAHFQLLRRKPLADALRTTCDCRGCEFFRRRRTEIEAA